ncbi:von Willebrand factor type A domain-containing protein [Pseudoneurospora amorphoporcata]|uniref:von Willebrand factor type A domain-containing protein n=1 Tax=Pseudoneurospora amorphoporcata TaxID=241081 RepID=A0AAN6SD98_9PEZI|nr:von Willebrand factor type A domain-containing protein [Pseudoneurospora amorphoporcata]
MYGHASHGHVTGLYYTEPLNEWHLQRRYLPHLELSVYTHIVGSSSRTTLTQTYVNPFVEKSIPELRYTFPLYDGVSVVGFVCTINGDRVIRGVVKEKSQARKVYQEAVDRGETAGLLEQLPNASDVFTTTVGNVPSGASLKVEITYLGELKNDAGVDGIRYTIPTSVAPRYGDFPGTLLDAPQAVTKSGIQITVDVETPNGSNIKSIQSPSHPISVTIGNTSSGAAAGTDVSLQKASATLALGTAELAQDFILQVVATNTGNPIALLETHPDIPQQRALMATLVPKFNLPSSRPEIVFVCDRSGSMGGARIEGLKSALRIFLKSIPVGAKFNICSFGSRHEFLFPDGSRSYDQESLSRAMEYTNWMQADFGGTEMYRPLEAAFEKRYKDMELEVFLLTDGEIWDQERLFIMINKKVSESKGAIRLFTLGIGNDVSHALIEGVARAGNAFAQSVTDDEKMNAKVVRMLKAGLTPHIKDYTLEIKYDKASEVEAKSKNAGGDDLEIDDDFEIVEKVHDSLAIRLAEDKTSGGADKPAEPVKPISLFNPSAVLDTEMPDADIDTASGGKYSHVPSVPEPKILQAPFAIPPLYPFIRTTVYLLLSPGTTQKTPKSVVLRATSVHGPLELEIPVAVLEQKGQTIHQLAARKAVQELEEGRGWLYHAKDSEDPEQKLLKEKYEGRFSDMVEREAVRLGVTFQVGSKWCSYVAVEKDRTEHEVKQQVSGSSLTEDEDSSKSESVVVKKRSMGGKSKASFDVDSHYLASPVGGNAFGQLNAARCSLRSTGGGVFGAYQAPPPNSSRPMASLFGGSQGKSDSSCGISPSRLYSMLSGCPSYRVTMPPPTLCCSQSLSGDTFSVPPNPLDFQRVPFPSTLDSKDLVPLDSLDSFFVPSTSDSDSDDIVPPTAVQMTPLKVVGGAAPASISAISLFGASVSHSSESTDVKPEMATPLEPLEALVNLQQFDGSWSWSQQLLDILGQSQSTEERYGVSVPNTNILATALVLAYLEVKLADEEDEWEILADKAREWLRSELASSGQQGLLSVEEYVEKIKQAL